MPATFTEALAQVRNDVRKCRVGRFVSSFPEEEGVALQEMLDIMTPHRMHKLLLTVDGMTKGTVPSSYAIRQHQRKECMCHL